ncbi:hypothetical protein CEXT_224321 [Caerostris extrusa]|uniref:Uncharacterized protein n=1 Tax=Caerostris extrusa TaxID=172846 RepID=A0AAV4XDT9_CAEEX|nr:hypothetical protein CEXT_224321 [Caerostris extrusa]
MERINSSERRKDKLLMYMCGENNNNKRKKKKKEYRERGVADAAVAICGASAPTRQTIVDVEAADDSGGDVIDFVTSRAAGFSPRSKE